MKTIFVLAALLLVMAPTAAAARSGPLRVGAELRIHPTAVDVAETAWFTLENTGDVGLAHSASYKLERWTAGGWRLINRRQGWPALLLGLAPGETSRPEPIGIVRLNPAFERCPRSEPCCVRVVLRPGLYRVTKSFDSAVGMLTARGTFRVVDRPTGTAE
jgi:hypothetical protein